MSYCRTRIRLIVVRRGARVAIQKAIGVMERPSSAQHPFLLLSYILWYHFWGHVIRENT